MNALERLFENDPKWFHMDLGDIILADSVEENWPLYQAIQDALYYDDKKHMAKLGRMIIENVEANGYATEEDE